MSNTIRLNVTGHYDEAAANAALSPGHLIEILSTGKVRKHASAGAKVLARFAVEDALQGKTIDDAYAADDVVGFVAPKKGDVVNALLAAGNVYAKGDKLFSAGDGTLTNENNSAATYEPLAEVKDALDLSGTGDVATHTAVTIL